ncbi:hypothetical protein BCR43DRAFT_488990 [Syncephalastrum racemosum]|uniref:Uncharacterized protein n=1 Tax=Syncephalastrum racemosum TaxID=13706 RepID=A0A1X2HL03_SYNRA|nr:hypothetical protein BCR43DRAFT_488990 [Syncephalastrum racemosum]
MADIELIADPQAAAVSPWVKTVELVKEGLLESAIALQPRTGDFLDLLHPRDVGEDTAQELLTSSRLSVAVQDEALIRHMSLIDLTARPANRQHLFAGQVSYYIRSLRLRIDEAEHLFDRYRQEYPADSVFVEQFLEQLHLGGRVTHVFVRYVGCTGEDTPLGCLQEGAMPDKLLSLPDACLYCQGISISRLSDATLFIARPNSGCPSSPRTSHSPISPAYNPILLDCGVGQVTKRPRSPLPSITSSVRLPTTCGLVLRGPAAAIKSQRPCADFSANDRDVSLAGNGHAGLGAGSHGILLLQGWVFVRAKRVSRADRRASGHRLRSRIRSNSGNTPIPRDPKYAILIRRLHPGFVSYGAAEPIILQYMHLTWCKTVVLLGVETAQSHEPSS